MPNCRNIEDLGMSNKTNLCDHCRNEFANCGGDNVVFGDGKGKDNVVACSKFEVVNSVSCPYIIRQVISLLRSSNTSKAYREDMANLLEKRVYGPMVEEQIKSTGKPIAVKNTSEAKRDRRPQMKNRGWEPGSIGHFCKSCNMLFLGSKDATTCADCAYGRMVL